jgi:protein-disulfide isomerase
MNRNRNRRLLALASALMSIVAAVAMIASGAGAAAGAASDGAEAGKIGGVQAVGSLLGEIPQEGMTLGAPSAPVELIEYGDLTCPVCKDAAQRLLAPVIRSEIAKGKAKLTFRNFLIIGKESAAAGDAAVAAGEQGHGWSFIELFLRNQGEENSGYVTGEFLESVATAAGVEDLARWDAARRSGKVEARVNKTTHEAEDLDLIGTPTFAVRGPKTHGLKVIGTPGGPGPLKKAIEAAG